MRDSLREIRTVSVWCSVLLYLLWLCSPGAAQEALRTETVLAEAARVKKAARKTGGLDLLSVAPSLLQVGLDNRVVVTALSSGRRLKRSALVLESRGRRGRRIAARLNDAGEAPDETAGDGILTGSFTAAAGRHRYTLAAKRRSRGGTDFSIWAGADLQAVEGVLAGVPRASATNDKGMGEFFEFSS